MKKMTSIFNSEELYVLQLIHTNTELLCMISNQAVRAHKADIKRRILHNYVCQTYINVTTLHGILKKFYYDAYNAREQIETIMERMSFPVRITE